MPSAERLRVGQYIEADPLVHPDLADQRLLIIQVFEPKPNSNRPVMYAVRGPGGLVTGLYGQYVRQIAESEALPARATLKPGTLPRVVTTDAEEKVHMSATQNIINLANQIFRDERLPFYGEAVKKASARLEKETSAYKKQFTSPSSKPISLTARSSENEVRAELERVKRERNLSTYAEAADVILCLAGAAHFEARVTQLQASGLDPKAALNRAQEEDRQGAEYYQASKLL